MKIEMFPIDDIKPYPQNPRVNDAAVNAVAASLKESRVGIRFQRVTRGVRGDGKLGLRQQHRGR